MHACVRSPTANAAAPDPSGTRPLRDEFERAITRRSRRIRGLVRRTAGYEVDYLNLSANAEPPEPPLGIEQREELQRKFLQWLREAIREELLEPVPRGEVLSGAHWTGGYVRAAYESGWQQATDRLHREGASTAGLQAVFDAPVSTQSLRRLYTKAYDDLEDITSVQAERMRETLSLAFARGWNPKKAAAELTSELRSIERRHLVTYARTFILDTHNDAALDRYEQAGVETVAHGEWLATDDGRTCPVCEALDGREFAIGEFRTGSFEFDAADDDVDDSLAGTYRLKPPIHPRGRCTVIPVI